MRLGPKASPLLLTIGATCLPLLFAFGPAEAQEQNRREPVLSVSGQGEAAVAPDMAIVSLSVLRQAKTAGAAVAANTTAMNEVMSALKADGIAERDIQTSNFSIYPQYRRSETKNGTIETQEIVGYEVTNALSVKVRDLSKLGGLIDQSVKLGVNSGGEITFTNDKPEAAITDARKAAVAEALDKAKTLTEAAGVKLGKILEISEGYARPMPPQPMMRMSMAKDMAPAPVPVAAGENTYSVTVNVTFSLTE
jgi:uncharacterized protein YggE